MKMTLEENTEYSKEVLKPIMQAIDKAVKEYDIARLTETFETMRSQTGQLGAWPFPETMDKAERVKIINEMYSLILDLIKLRKKQIEMAENSVGKLTAGQEILKQLGF